MAKKKMQEDRLEVENRLTTVENGLTEIGNDVKEIRDNHLVHLDAKMDRIHWLIVTTLITGLVTLISKWLV